MPLHTVLHEIAHHWAGNRTTLAHTLDYAWKEAIAEYLSYVFEEAQRPPAEATSARRLWHGTGSGAPYPVRPLDDPGVPLSVWASGGCGASQSARVNVDFDYRTLVLDGVKKSAACARSTASSIARSRRTATSTGIAAIRTPCSPIA